MGMNLDPADVFGSLALLAGGVALVAGCALGWGAGDAIFAPSCSKAERQGVAMVKIAGPMMLVAMILMAGFGMAWNELEMREAIAGLIQ
jgi:hypothetical protein